MHTCMAELKTMATKGVQDEAGINQTEHSPLAADVRTPLEALLKIISSLIQQVKGTYGMPATELDIT